MSYLYSNSLTRNVFKSKIQNKSAKILIKQEISKQFLESLSAGMVKAVKNNLINEFK